MRRPQFIAEQSRHASGLIGRIVAWVMARETFADNQRAINALAIESTNHVLDIGTGHGRALAQIVSLTPQGAVTGVDPSPLMAKIAHARNKTDVRSGRLRIAVAGVEALPFANASFDKAMAVHAIYFWPDLTPALREIARVLKPDGRLALVFHTPENEAAVNAFPDGIYTFRTSMEIHDALASAGLIVVTTPDEQGNTPNNAVGAALLVARKPA
ncbi:MAG: class I SAM-dependent methyltransferase [Sphingopyxis sp.]